MWRKVGFKHLQITAHHGDVAGALFKQLAEAFAGDAQFLAQAAAFLLVHAQFEHELHFAFVIEDRCRMHQHGDFLAVLVAQDLLAARAAALHNGPLHGEHGLVAVQDIGLPARVPHEIAEAFAVEIVDGKDFHKPVVHGDETGQLVEGLLLSAHGRAEGVQPEGKAVHDLPGGELTLRLHELRGLLIDHFFEIRRVFFELVAHGDALKGAFQGNVQQIVVDGFGDEVGRFQLEPLNRHFQIRMSGNEDDFGFRREDLDVLQEIQPVHAGHPDVGDHDGDGPFREKLQGFLPRGHGDDVVPGVAERKTHDGTDALFVVDEENGFFHESSLRWFASAAAGVRSTRSGNTMRNSAPLSGRFSHRSRPPISKSALRVPSSPNPVPSFLVVNKPSRSRSAASALSTVPLSRTS